MLVLDNPFGTFKQNPGCLSQEDSFETVLDLVAGRLEGPHLVGHRFESQPQNSVLGERRAGDFAFPAAHCWINWSKVRARDEKKMMVGVYFGDFDVKCTSLDL